MGEPDAESGPYNLCKYKHFAPHAHAILRFFRAHKPTMALLSPAEPLSHSALCFYRGKIPWRFVFDALHRAFGGGNVPFAPLDRVLAPYDGSSSQANLSPASRQSFPPSHCRRKGGGEFWLKMGKKTETTPAFSVPPPLFFPSRRLPCSLSRCLFALRLRPTESMSRPNFAARCASSNCRDGLRWTRDGRASFAGTSTGCSAKGNKNAPGLRK